MDKLFGIPVVDDDALCARLIQEGYECNGESDAYNTLAERGIDQCGLWPMCRCPETCDSLPALRLVRSAGGRLAFQDVDRRTGRPEAPESKRLQRDAATFAYDHREAQSWLPDTWSILGLGTCSSRCKTDPEEPTYMGYPVADLVSPDY